MKDYIINSFILHDNNTLIDIYKYIKFRYDNSVEINDIKTELTKLIKKDATSLYSSSRIELLCFFSFLLYRYGTVSPKLYR